MTKEKEEQTTIRIPKNMIIPWTVFTETKLPYLLLGTIHLLASTGALEDGSDISAKEIGEALGTTEGTIIGVLIKLRNKGYIRETHDIEGSKRKMRFLSDDFMPIKKAVDSLKRRK
jgi:hypothetical protein